MTVLGYGSQEAIDVMLPDRSGRTARIVAHADDGLVAISLDANHLRVLAKLAEAAADELDARAIGGGL